MICENCHKKINVTAWYYEVIQRNKKKIIEKKFVHKNCQDDFDKKVRENMISPEQKKAMIQALAVGFQKIGQIQKQIGSSQ